MKKVYSIITIALLFSAFNAFAQFTYLNVDSIKHGIPGDELVCAAKITNTTSNSIQLDVVRISNVMNDAPNWTSAYCMLVCYPDFVDSTRETLAALETIDFTFHFYTDATPDSATGIMKWVSVSNPTTKFTKKFYGVTKTTIGINEPVQNAASVSIYPMPLRAGENFTADISRQTSNFPASIVIYNMMGSEVAKVNNVANGMNIMNLSLSAGIYSYNLISEGLVLKSGKLSIVK
ncbi:MAG TPA: T9SS type A sorting domain-containing protein [Bacteroidia bacterium]|nr:T9SS type A sorting domain-containing protein [Bacteroidia bacterium]